MKAKQTILLGGVACGTLAILGGLFVPGIYGLGNASALTDWTDGGTYEGVAANCKGETSGNNCMKTEGSVNVQFTFDTSLTIDVSDDIVSINNLTPGQRKTSKDFNSTLTITTTTNNATGYTLKAKVGDATHTTADLTSGTGAGAAKIASIGSSTTLPSSGDVALWGFSTDGGQNFKGFVDTSNAVVLKTSTTATAADGDAVSFDIGAYAPTGQPSGTYTNTITFISTTDVVTP